MELSITPATQQVACTALASVYEDYINELALSRTRITITSYKNQIAPFFLWWNTFGQALAYALSKPAFEKFGRWLEHDYRNTKGRQPRQNTRRTTCRRVRQYLKWCYTTGRLGIDISPWCPLPSIEKTRIRTLNTEEIETVLSSCHGHMRVRNMAMIALFLETGCRTVEIANAEWSNVEFKPDFSGTLYLEVVKGYLDHDKRRTVVFGQKSGKMLQLLRVFLGVDRGSIFDITNSGITHAIREVASKAAVDFNAKHCRKTFSTYWTLHCHTPSPSLAELLLDVQLGHSARTIAQRHYIGLDHTNVEEYYVSPLDKIDMFGM